MRLDKIGSKITFEEDFIEDKEDYRRKFIDIFSACFIEEDDWLTTRQKDFVMALIEILELDRRDLYSEDMLEIFKKYRFKDKRTVQTWRKDIVKKGWLIVQDDKFYMDRVFEMFVVDKLNHISFNIDLFEKKNEDE